MKSGRQLRLHRLVRLLGWSTGIGVIALAVLMGLAQLLLPLVARHPAWVAQQLSQRLQRPVSFASLQGRWTPSGPLFVMRDVSVGAAAGESGQLLTVPEAELKLDFGGLLLPSRHFFNVHVHGLQLDVARDAAGQWHVNGMSVAGGADRQPLSLGRFSMDLWLDDLRVVVSAAGRPAPWTLLVQQLRLSRRGDVVRFGGRLQRAGETAALRMAGNFNVDGRSGKLWLGVARVDLQPLLAGIDTDGYTAKSGHGSIAAWVSWRNGMLERSLLRVDVDQLAVASPSGATANVTALHGLAGLRRTADGYALRWAADDGGALALNLHDPGTAGLRVGVAARQLQLAPWLPWLALKPGLTPAVAAWLGRGRPQARLDQLDLQWSKLAGIRSLQLGFAGLAIHPVGTLPGLSPLHGELRGDTQALSLHLPAQSATLTWPARLREPVVLTAIDTTAAAWRRDGDWRVGVDALNLAGSGFTAQLRGDMTLPAQGGKPRVDFYASLGKLDLAVAKRFLPLGVLSPGTIAWLDHSLVSGQLAQSRVVLHGDLANWPFLHNEGRFEAQAEVNDLVLDYGKYWPRASGIHAVARFINSGMLVETDAGQSVGVKTSKAVAVIPDFAAGLLDLNVQGSGTGAQLMDFVSHSPIGSHQADTLAKLSLGGSADFQFHLTLPLKHPADAQLDGSAQLKDADLSAPAWNLQLDQLSGPLQFDLHGMRAGPLDASLHGQPSQLQLKLAAANKDPDTVLSAQLRGRYAIAELVRDYPSLQWLGASAEGRSDFTVGFSIAHPAGANAVSQTLTVDSPLQGIQLKLPAPLDKPAFSSLPLQLTLGLPISGGQLQFGLGQLLRGRLQLPETVGQALRGTLVWGDVMPVEMPPQGLRLRGHADQLDVTGWVQRMVGGGSGDGPSLESLDIRADHALWFGYPMGAMTLRGKPLPGALSFDVAGAAIAGNLSVPTQDIDKRGITARMQRLYWPKDTAAAAQAKANAKLSAGSKTAPPPAARNPTDTGINPAALPPLHLWVSDLRLGDAKLGDARLETWPTVKGMHIEQLRALSSRVQINASGDWNGSASDSHTHMHIAFAADDLGAMLSAFGFEGMVNGGKTDDQLDATWPGAPSALSLDTMDGTLSVHVTDGRIPEVASPGVGRLLGLVSLAELPRRLTLDFGDVFGKGLGFDLIAGNFRLADGNATTSNLVINGPSANISISGRTGLRAHDYDQQVEVVPHIGNSLPLVGAVVGGPVGAAAGLAVQGLLGKGLNHAAVKRYHVTGSWDKPVMTLVDKDDARVRPPLAMPPATPAPAAASSTASPAAGHR